MKQIISSNGPDTGGGRSGQSNPGRSFMSRFSTSDIIVISMFGALGIISGILGNVFHGLSGMIPFIGPVILHTVIPGIVIFACLAVVRKVGTATLLCLITSLVAMPLMGVPIFIVMYIAYGILLDGAMVLLGEGMWTKTGIAIAGAAYGLVGIVMLYGLILPLTGLVFPLWIFLSSIPVNVAFAIPSALIGMKIGNRASIALKG